MIILRSLFIILQAHRLNYDMIIENHKHYLRYGIHHFKNSKYYLQKHFEIIKLMLLLLQLIAQRSITNIYQNPKHSLTIRVHEG